MPGSVVTRRAVLTGVLAGVGTLAGCSGRLSAPEAPSTASVPGSATPRGGRSGANAVAPDRTDSASGTQGPPTGAEDHGPPGDPGLVASRATVPVLCYHQVRPWAPEDSGYNRASLICPPERFRAQLDGLAAAGYTTISPDDYWAHLRGDGALPGKPVLLTFDDGKDNQVDVAAAELAKRRMTGTFFIMTVVIGNPGWVSRRDVRTLADTGMTVGSHTWDHQDVRKLRGKDWAAQFAQPRATLAKLSGQPVADLAFPYGAWNRAALPRLIDAGYRSAYQLDLQPLDAKYPQLTLRRSMVTSTWTGPQIVAAVERLSAQT